MIQFEEMFDEQQKCHKHYVDAGFTCPGDMGAVECFFCPGCVLGIDERISNLREWMGKNHEIRT